MVVDNADSARSEQPYPEGGARGGRGSTTVERMINAAKFTKGQVVVTRNCAAPSIVGVSVLSRALYSKQGKTRLGKYNLDVFATYYYRDVILDI